MKGIDFKKKRCVPCEGGVPILSSWEAREYLKKLREWKLSKDGRSIGAQYVMKDFMAAIFFINRIARLAEKEGHHPDVHLTGYRHIRIDLSTHAIKGLSMNDFILAAKITGLPKALKK